MIEVCNIQKAFFNQTVLNRISFSVEEGKSLVILGQSGVGKTVLLKILAQLLSPDEGTVIVRSKSVGMLFQKNALFDSLTVFENLEFPLKEKGERDPLKRKQKIEKFLDWVGLSQSAQLFPDSLSGGMQKRLGIARALIIEPKVLFYDEPTAGLDPITSRKIAELILTLKNEFGSTIVSVTSDVFRAYQMADKIGLLYRTEEGAHFLETGTPEQTKTNSNALISQFVQGKTNGPLTETDWMEQKPLMGAADLLLGSSLTERIDVDYF